MICVILIQAIQGYFYRQLVTKATMESRQRGRPAAYDQSINVSFRGRSLASRATWNPGVDVDSFPQDFVPRSAVSPGVATGKKNGSTKATKYQAML